MAMLNWTNLGKTDGYRATEPGRTYTAVRKSGRFYLTVSSPTGTITLGKGNLSQVREIAQRFHDQATQTAETTQTDNAINSPQTAPDAPNDAQGVEPPPDAATGQPDAPAADSYHGDVARKTDDIQATPEPTVSDSVQPNPTEQVMTMVSAAQKTKAPAKGDKKAPAKTKPATKPAKAEANGKPEPVPAKTDPKPVPPPDGMAPAVRSDKLKPTDAPVGDAWPPDNVNPDKVLAWAEGLRDEAAKDGKLLSVQALIATARGCCGEMSGKVVRLLKQLYKAEYTPADPNAEPAPGPAPKVKAGRPKGNGTKPASKTEYTAAKVKPNSLGIPVEAKVSGTSGKVHPTVFGITPRAILRWMGSDGWTYEEGKAAMEKLGLYKLCFENKTTDHIKDQMASGRRGDKKDGGWAGDLPDLTKEQKATLRKLKA